MVHPGDSTTEGLSILEDLEELVALEIVLQAKELMDRAVSGGAQILSQRLVSRLPPEVPCRP